MVSTILSSLAAKIAFAGVALATTTGGLAATGALPDPAQQVVSDVASRIGISIPAPNDRTEDETEIGTPPEPSDEAVVREPPDLPDESSETSKHVVKTVFDGDPSSEGADFGERVADKASGGRSNASDNPDEGTPEGDDDGGDGPRIFPEARRSTRAVAPPRTEAPNVPDAGARHRPRSTCYSARGANVLPGTHHARDSGAAVALR